MNIERLTSLSAEDLDAIKRAFPDHELTKDGANDFIKNANNYLLVSRSGQSIIGVLAAYYLPWIDRNKSSIILYEIEVHSEHRKKGVGTALVQKLKDIAREEKIPEVWVITINLTLLQWRYIKELEEYRRMKTISS
jgi:N-acetylglutamate synthase-like GNAT family acetyltransferase